ncbi:hypothetical protein ABZ281_24290, partial [Streptomyces sp. NPDC006265]|uniref:hypothetical protein n=1 Tax=Streptomyces sp. NPDC006265 TaxID=3156740 RepID=UPI0033BE44C8
MATESWTWLEIRPPPPRSGTLERGPVGAGLYAELTGLPQVHAGIRDLAPLLPDPLRGAFCAQRVSVLENPAGASEVLERPADSHTTFTGVPIEVLRSGVADGSQTLSLSDLYGNHAVDSRPRALPCRRSRRTTTPAKSPSPVTEPGRPRHRQPRPGSSQATARHTAPAPAP